MGMLKNLQELTGQESGIVIYENGAVLCNWSSIDGLPRIFVTGLIGLGEEIPEIKGEHYDDLSFLLDEVEITALSDDAEIPESGTVYRISDDVTVVAPDDWA